MMKWFVNGCKNILKYSLVSFVVSILLVSNTGFVVNELSIVQEINADSVVTNLNTTTAYLVKVMIPTTLVGGVYRPKMNVYGSGLDLTEVTTLSDLNGSEEHGVYCIHRYFIIAPGRSAKFYVVNEYGFATDYPFPTSAENLLGDSINITSYDNKTASIAVPGSIDLTGDEKVISNVIILDEYVFSLLDDSSVNYQDSGNYGKSFGNPVLLKTENELVTAAKLMINPDGATQSDYDIFRSKGMVLPADKNAASAIIRKAYYRINNNVVITNPSFNGFGSVEYPFEGFIDGAGCSVSFDIMASNVFNYYAGFVSYTSGTNLALVRNISIYGSINVTVGTGSSRGVVAAGGIAGYIDNMNMLLVNCSSYISYSVNAGSSGVDCDIYVGGLIGYVKSAPIMATFPLSNSATPEQRAMDVRLKFNGFNVAMIVNSDRPNSDIYMSAGIGYAENTYIRGLVIDFDQCILNGISKRSAYVAGVAGYFRNYSRTALAGNSLYGSNLFTINAVTNNTANAIVDVAAAAICAYVNQSGGALSLVSLYNNVVDTDHGLVPKNGLAKITASDGTAVDANGWGTCVANIYAGGYYAKFNNNTNAEIQIPSEYAGMDRPILNGQFQIEAIQNGRPWINTAGAASDPSCMWSSQPGNNSYFASVGNVYAGGLSAFGLPNFIGKVRFSFSNISVKARQKYSATTLGSGSIPSNVTVKTGIVAAGILCGAFNNISGVTWNPAVEGIYIHTNKSSVDVTREAGSNSISGIHAGGLFGRVNIYSQNTSTMPILTSGPVYPVDLSDFEIYFENTQINGNSLSYNSVPYNGNYSFYRIENAAQLFVGGLVGSALNLNVRNTKLLGKMSKVSAIQNSQGGTDMVVADAYVGGMIGGNYASGNNAYGNLDNVSVKGVGLVTKDVTGNYQAGFSVSLIGNNSCNSPSVGGVIGAYFKSTNNTTVTVNNATVDSIYVYGEVYSNLIQQNIDVMVGGVVATAFGTSNINPVLANSFIYNSVVKAHGRNNCLAKAGGFLASQYGFTSSLAQPMILNCISMNNTYISSSQYTYNAAAPIFGAQYHGTHYIANCSSFNDEVYAYSSNSLSIGGGIVGEIEVGLTLYMNKCFSNAKLFVTNGTANNIRRGGLIGAEFSDQSGLANPRLAKINDSYFHYQNAGTKNSMMTSGLRGGMFPNFTFDSPKNINQNQYLDFTDILLGLDKPSQLIFNPSDVPSAPSTGQYSITAMKNTYTIDARSYQSYITDNPALVLNSAPVLTNNANYLTQYSANSWGFYSKSGIGDVFGDSYLFITPYSGAKAYNFGKLKAIVSFEHNVPTPSDVKLFEGQSFNYQIMSNSSFNINIGSSKSFSAYTRLNGETTPSNYDDNFHNVVWSFSENGVVNGSGRFTNEVPYSQLNKYASFDITNNVVTVNANITIDKDYEFYVMAIDYISGAKVTSVIKITIKPILVNGLIINSLYGVARDSSNYLNLTLLGNSAANPYVISTNNVVRFFATVSPNTATLKDYTFVPKTGTYHSVKADGTIIATNTPVSAFQITAVSDGKDINGNALDDSVWVRIEAPLPIITSNDGTAVIEARPLMIKSPDYVYSFTAEPFPSKVVNPVSGLPKTVIISSINLGSSTPIKSEVIVQEGVFNASSFVTYDLATNTFSFSGAKLWNSSLCGATAYPPRLMIEIGYYDVLPVVFDTQVTGASLNVISVPFGFTLSEIVGNKQAILPQYKDILEPKWGGRDFKGYLNLPRPTNAQGATEVAWNNPITGSTRYYARWQNIVTIENSSIVNTIESIEMPNMAVTAVISKYDIDTNPYPNSPLNDFTFLPYTSFMDFTFTVFVNTQYYKGMPKAIAYLGEGIDALRFELPEPLYGTNPLPNGYPDPYSLHYEADSGIAYYTFVIPAQVLSRIFNGRIHLEIYPDMIYIPGIESAPANESIMPQDGIFTISYTMTHADSSEYGLTPSTAYQASNRDKFKDVEFNFYEVESSIDRIWSWQDVFGWKITNRLSESVSAKNTQVLTGLPNGTIIQLHHTVMYPNSNKPAFRETLYYVFKDEDIGMNHCIKLSQMKVMGSDRLYEPITYQQFTSGVNEINETYYLVVKPPVGSKAFETISSFSKLTNTDPTPNVVIHNIPPDSPSEYYWIDTTNLNNYACKATLLANSDVTNITSMVGYDIVNQREINFVLNDVNYNTTSHIVTIDQTYNNTMINGSGTNDGSGNEKYDWRNIRFDKDDNKIYQKTLGYGIQMRNEVTGELIPFPNRTLIKLGSSSLTVISDKGLGFTNKPVYTAYIPAESGDIELTFFQFTRFNGSDPIYDLTDPPSNVVFELILLDYEPNSLYLKLSGSGNGLFNTYYDTNWTGFGAGLVRQIEVIDLYP